MDGMASAGVDGRRNGTARAVRVGADVDYTDGRTGKQW